MGLGATRTECGDQSVLDVGIRCVKLLDGRSEGKAKEGAVHERRFQTYCN